ncbi:MAG: IS5 family transposase [Waddliaceae bacterium]
MIRSVFHLPLRALQGFLTSLVTLMRVFIPIPYYTQICRRAKSLGQDLCRLSERDITDPVIDSTGLKVYGEGEWKVRRHGYSKRRTWRKLHLAVCPDSNEILFEILTENNVSDCDIYPEFAEASPETIERIYCDGAYDTEGCYQASTAHGLDLITPPQKNAVFKKNAPPHMQARNNAVLEILGLGGNEEGRKLWKKLKGYHRRSLGETAMFRFKQLFGNDLKSRGHATQKAEARVKCEALNMMTRLGMPEGEWLAA